MKALILIILLSSVALAMKYTYSTGQMLLKTPLKNKALEINTTEWFKDNDDMFCVILPKGDMISYCNDGGCIDSNALCVRGIEERSGY